MFIIFLSENTEEEKNILKKEKIVEGRHDHLNHHDQRVDPANVGVISQMSLDRTGMELNVIPAEIIVLIMIIFEI